MFIMQSSKILSRFVSSHLVSSRLAITLFVLSLSSSAFALTPEETVKEIVEKIKSAGTPAPIVEYVDWESAFSGIPQEQRSMMKLASAQEMKVAYTKVINDPVAAIKERMEAQIATLPADKQAEAKEKVKMMEQSINKQKAEMTDRIKQTEYQVGKADVKGDTATVNLVQDFKGDKKEQQVKLIKKGDAWLLASQEMFSKPAAPQAPAKTNGAPAANTETAPMKK
jgi:hypothetical protein